MEEKNPVCRANETFEIRGCLGEKNRSSLTRYTRADLVQVEKKNNKTMFRISSMMRTDEALCVQPPCREWMYWLLQCGLIESSHRPRSRSGLYTDFT